MKKYISIICITLAIVSGSCKKTYLDELKNNPNAPSVASPPLLLSGALKTIGRYNQRRAKSNAIPPATDIILICLLDRLFELEHKLSTEHTALDAYQFTNATYDVWTPLYLNLSNL